MTGDTAGPARAQSPGTELSRERERQGLSQQQVAEQLNLDVSVIHWIENDDFAALGAPVFAKGHLRRYASLLGLPPERLLAAYEQAGTHLQPTLIPRAREDHVPPRPPPRWPWVLGGVAGVLLLAAFVAFVLERWSSQSSSPSVPPAAATPPPGDVPAGAQTQVVPAAAPSATEAAPDAGQITLELSFTKDTWVEVYDGSGAAVLYDLGSRGTERTLRAIAPLSVTLGDPQSVTLHANGRRLSIPAAPSGQTLTRFSIDAAGVVR